MLNHIVIFFYDIFLDYRIQQNNFNYQKVLDFSYGILYFFECHCYKNSLQPHDQHLMTFRSCLTFLLRNLSNDGRILMQMGDYFGFNRPFLNKMKDGLIFRYLLCSCLLLHGLIISVGYFVYLYLQLMELMEHIQSQGLEQKLQNYSGNLVVRFGFVINRSLIMIY